MNTRELQSEVLRLQGELARRSADCQTQKQKYEQIIDELQKDNARLRAELSEEPHLPKHPEMEEREIPDSEVESLRRTNAALRHELH